MNAQQRSVQLDARADQAGPDTMWGIRGGMGPMSSADLVMRIYSNCASVPEQSRPRLILLSDPSVRDRSHALSNGDDLGLAEEIARGAERLIAMGADKVAICCVTAHCVTHLLSSQLRERFLHPPALGRRRPPDSARACVGGLGNPRGHIRIQIVE